MGKRPWQCTRAQALGDRFGARAEAMAERPSKERGFAMKKLVTLALVLLVGLWAAKKVSLFSYAGTVWSQVSTEAKSQVPTRFELERVRHEIAQMDGDIGKMIRPIAEHMAAINQLKKDIKTNRDNLEDQKTVLLALSKDLESNAPTLSYGGESYSADRLRQKLQRDFASFKRQEKNLHSQEKLLEAKERSLAGTRDQLAKLIAKKHEYEVRLAQLQADEETLQVARLGTRVEIDDSRATEIESALKEIERRHEVQRAEIELRTGNMATDNIPVGQQPPLDPRGIRTYLEGAAPPAVTRK